MEDDMRFIKGDELKISQEQLVLFFFFFNVVPQMNVRNPIQEDTSYCQPKYIL